MKRVIMPVFLVFLSILLIVGCNVIENEDTKQVDSLTLEKQLNSSLDEQTLLQQQYSTSEAEESKNSIKHYLMTDSGKYIYSSYQAESALSADDLYVFKDEQEMHLVTSCLKKGNIKERVTGIDFMGEICKESVKNSGKIFLYGAKEDVVEKAAEELKNKYPGLVISGTCDGYCDKEIAISKINNSNANILFVALGSPKQELFILENKEKLAKIKIFMPVGGSFDVISNNIKRAPKWVIKLNLEWLYRLIRQPWRFFRQLKLIKFIFLVIKEKRR